MARTTKHPLAGTTVVVTGAASGMGRALAQRCSRLGSPVAIADWSEEGLADTEASLSGPVLAHRLDVRDRQGLLAFAARVAEWSPAPLGAVINNAGVTVAQTVADAAIEDDEWVMGVNFGGVVNGTHAFLPLLLEQDSGALVNISSAFGLIGFPNQSAYAASKHAVRGFTESLRHELRGSGVRPTLVHPGGVRTNIVNNARFHADGAGSADLSEMSQRFDAVARTTPDKAAKIICSGIERGDPRIRVGGDAVFLDLLVRVAPVRYYDVLERLAALSERRQAR